MKKLSKCPWTWINVCIKWWRAPVLWGIHVLFMAIVTQDKIGREIAAKLVAQSEICFQELINKGSCSRGQGHCHFSHDIPAEKRRDTNFVQKVRQEMQIKKICVNEYRQVMSCRKGETCKFRHNIDESERSDHAIQQFMRERWEKSPRWRGNKILQVLKIN